MIFAQIRSLIFSPLILIVEGKKLYDVETLDPAIDIYDYYEVIGIRADYYDHETYIVVSLKAKDTSYYEE